MARGREAEAALPGQACGMGPRLDSGCTQGRKRRGSLAPSTALHRETHEECAPVSFYGGNQKHMGEVRVLTLSRKGYRSPAIDV